MSVQSIIGAMQKRWAEALMAATWRISAAQTSRGTLRPPQWSKRSHRTRRRAPRVHPPPVYSSRRDRHADGCRAGRRYLPVARSRCGTGAIPMRVSSGRRKTTTNRTGTPLRMSIPLARECMRDAASFERRTVAFLRISPPARGALPDHNPKERQCRMQVANAYSIMQFLVVSRTGVDRC